jgi:hypothetical protein
MGYDLHITRRTNWSHNGDDISLEEWLEIIKNDPELKLDTANGPYFALWSGKSTLQDPWLDWFDGQIQTKNPDGALINKMVIIANKLGARFQGDDGEFYTSATNAPKTPKRTKIWLFTFSLVISGIFLYFFFVELIMFILYNRLDSNSYFPLLLGFILWAIVMFSLYKILCVIKARKSGQRIQMIEKSRKNFKR